MIRIFLIYIALALTLPSLCLAADKTFTAGESVVLTGNTTWDSAYSTATSDSWATVTGAYDIIIDDITDIQYVSFQNTGSITFNIDSAGDYLRLRNLVLEGQTFINVGSGTTPLTSSIIIDGCDFRNQTTDNFLTIAGVAGATEAEAYIRNSSFDQTTDRVMVIKDITGVRVEDNVLNNVQFGNMVGSNWDMAGNITYRRNFQTCDSDVTMDKHLVTHGTEAGNNILNNYWYLDHSNPHSYGSTGTGDSGPDRFVGNIFEVVFNTDGANIIGASGDRDLLIEYNLHLGSGSLINAVNDGTSTITGKNNTSYGKIAGNNGDGLLFLYEHASVSYTVNLSNNIVTGSADPGEAVTSLSGAQTMAYSDYNWFYDVTTPYGSEITVTSGQTNDTTGISPDFVDETRNLLTWYGIKYSDGTPTKAEAVEKLLVVNGYNATTKTQSDPIIDYDQADLITWVKAGFVPQDAGINQGGVNGEDIGALDDEGWNVWADHSIVKNRRDGDDDTSGSQSHSFKMAKNEIEGFQVFTYATEALENVDIFVSDFVSGSNTIDNIYISKEHYIDTTMKSRPEYALGAWPDALIPKVDRIYNEYRSLGFPVNTLADDVQGFWIDIGTDASTVAGTYTGVVTIVADGKSPEEISVTLVVWDFTIPSTSTFPYMFSFNVGNLRYGHGAGLSSTETNLELERAYAMSHLYHRVVQKQTNSTDYYTYSWDGGSSTLTLDNTSIFDSIYGDYMDGTVISSGPYANAKFSAIVDSRLRGTWGVDSDGSIANADKQTAARQYLQQVYDHFESEGWNPFSTLFAETYDEPRCETDISFRGVTQSECEVVKQQGADVNSVNTGGAGMLDNSFVHTHNERVGLTDYEDYGFYSPNSYSFVCPGWDRDCTSGGTYVDKDGYSKPYWAYLACDNNGCTGDSETTSTSYNGQIDYSLDANPMYTRIISFYMRKYGSSGSFFWSTMYNYQEGTAEPYTDMHSFGSNGDGALLYPGITTRNGRSWDAGDHDDTPALGGVHDIPVESMRWKYIRDWSEDMEYMRLADDAVESTAVNVQTDTMFTDADILDAYWNLNMSPDDLLTARENIANLITGTGTTTRTSKPRSFNGIWR